MFASVMDLTSYERMRLFLELTQDSAVTKRQILNWIATTSARVQDFLGRQISIEARTEDQDVENGQFSFPVTAYPIISIASVYSDSTGLYDNATLLDFYHASSNADAINLTYPIPSGLRAFRTTYTGGLAYHATQSTFVFSVVAGIVVGNYIEGQSSYALGKVKVISGFSVTLEILLGRFQVAEAYKVFNTDALSGELESAAGVISSATVRCLAESHPLIVTATEMEIRYLHTHKKDFENQRSGKEGTDRRPTDATYELQPEVESLIYRYKKLTM